MANPLTPSQIDKLLDLFRAALRKLNPFSDEAQDLIEHHWDDVKAEVSTAVVDALNRVLVRTRNTIIRTVKVVRTSSPKEMLDATKRVQYTDKSVVEGIPKGEGEDVTVEFFKLGKYVSDETLDLEYQKRGLTPDPYAQAAVNEADPAFAEEYPNGTYWKDEDGNWCFIAFGRHGGGRCVDVGRNDDGWGDYWWFGGVRKPLQKVIMINRFKLFNPAKFIGKGWTIEEQDERSLALTEIDLSKVKFETCLQEGETNIQGEEKLKRLKQADHIRLDAHFFLTLWKNKHLIPESWKEKTNGNTTFIFFDGTVLRGPGGRRYVLCLCWRDGRWDWRCYWLGDVWFAYGPSAVLASN